MATNEEIFQQLQQEKTGFPVDKQDKLGLSKFASFLSFKKLPSNDDIEEKLKGDETKPSTIDQKELVDLHVDLSIFTDPDKSQETFNSKFMFVGLNSAARKKSAGDNQQVSSEDNLDWTQFHDLKIKTPTYKLAFMTNDERFRNCYITDILKDAIDSNAGNIADDYAIDAESKHPGRFLKSENRDELATEMYPKYVKRYEKALVRYSKESSVQVDGDQVTVTYKVPTAASEKIGPFFNSKEAYEKEVATNQEKYCQSAKTFIREYQIIQPEQLIVLGEKAQKILCNMEKAKLFDEESGLKEKIENLIEVRHYSYRGADSSTAGYMDYLNELLENVKSKEK